jgi:hypothetical protein
MQLQKNPRPIVTVQSGVIARKFDAHLEQVVFVFTIACNSVKITQPFALFCPALRGTVRNRKKNQYLRHRLSHSNSEALFGLLLPMRSTPALITNCNGTNNQMHALSKDEASLLHFAKTLHKFRRCCSQLE